MLLYFTLIPDNIPWTPRKVMVCDLYDYISPSYDIISVKKKNSLSASARMRCLKDTK